MSPKRPDLILSTHIPNIKLNILIRHRLDVKPHRGNRRNVLVQLQLIQYRCLPRSVESQHQEAHFLGPEDLAHHLGDLAAHCGEKGGTEICGGGEVSCCRRGR
jgi:hypothetical protein